MASIWDRRISAWLPRFVLHRFRVLRTSKPSLVRHCHGVGYRRSRGNLASLVTRSIGWSRMSLWSMQWLGDWTRPSRS
jgi:hypothetical protein